MDAPTPHLILAHDGPTPLDVLDEFERAVMVDGLVLRREPRPPTRASASMTLLASTGVGLFLTKAYFEDLSQTLGRAHGAKLDAALRDLGRRLMALRARRVNAPGVLDAAGRFWLALSVWTDRAAGGRFKMLIPADLPAEGLDAALSAYLVFAQAYHAGELEPEDLAILDGARPLADVVLLAYDGASGTIQPVDPFEGR